MGHKSRIMYIENKGGQYIERYPGYPETSGGELTGPGRIGRVTFSKSGLSLEYRGQHFGRHNGSKANYLCEETGEEYWISGPKKRGGDSLYATNITTKIDDDVREEYWTTIRKCPERVKETETL